MRPITVEIPPRSASSFKQKAVEDPRNTKHDLAYTITRMYHGEQAAKEARQHFEKTVINKNVPDDAPEFYYEAGSSHRLMDIISDAEMTSSNGETKRMMKQGGVSLDDKKVQDPNFTVKFESGDEMELKVGKRNFARLKSK